MLAVTMLLSLHIGDVIVAYAPGSIDAMMILALRPADPSEGRRVQRLRSRISKGGERFSDEVMPE